MLTTSLKLRHDFLPDFADFEFEQFDEVVLYKNEVM